MRNKTRFIPDPDFNKNMLLLPSTLAVYESSVEGAITITMSRDGVIQAGTRLTRYQASALVRTLTSLMGESDDDPHSLGFDLGYVAGHRDGEETGFEDGYERGFEDGSAEAEECRPMVSLSDWESK